MRRCQNVLLNMPDVLLDAICGAAKKYWLRTKNRKVTNAVRPVLMTEDSPAGEILQYIHFDTLELYTPKDESQIGFGLFGKCDWEKGREIEAVILDGRLIYFGVYMMSPWEYDKCREECIEECGTADDFDRSNYAL